ncbi:acyl carrier protein [Streptomyces solisilvae]|uniref:acyl carrier protein n=1 Tax=Streptomyces malaysiensis TaxID=92644 RepID=UPI0036C952C4
MFETLRDLLVNRLKVSPEQIRPEMTRDEAEIDSLAVVELSLLLEKELGVRVSDEELMEADSIGAMAELIESRKVSN